LILSLCGLHSCENIPARSCGHTIKDITFWLRCGPCWGHKLLKHWGGRFRFWCSKFMAIWTRNAKFLLLLRLRDWRCWLLAELRGIIRRLATEIFRVASGAWQRALGVLSSISITRTQLWSIELIDAMSVRAWTRNRASSIDTRIVNRMVRPISCIKQAFRPDEGEWSWLFSSRQTLTLSDPGNRNNLCIGSDPWWLWLGWLSVCR